MPNNLLVVIDHREARIYKAELHGTQPHRITPLDPHNAHRHLRNVELNTDGQRKTELKSFYEAVAASLRGADEILLMGSATGSSSAMDHLVAELKQHHHDLAARIVGTLVINEHHMTEDQILAQAREFYTAHSSQSPGVAHNG